MNKFRTLLLCTLFISPFCIAQPNQDMVGVWITKEIAFDTRDARTGLKVMEVTHDGNLTVWLFEKVGKGGDRYIRYQKKPRLEAKIIQWEPSLQFSYQNMRGEDRQLQFNLEFRNETRRYPKSIKVDHKYYGPVWYKVTEKDGICAHALMKKEHAIIDASNEKDVSGVTDALQSIDPDCLGRIPPNPKAKNWHMRAPTVRDRLWKSIHATKNAELIEAVYQIMPNDSNLKRALANTGTAIEPHLVDLYTRLMGVDTSTKLSDKQLSQQIEILSMGTYSDPTVLLPDSVLGGQWGCGRMKTKTRNAFVYFEGDEIKGTENIETEMVKILNDFAEARKRAMVDPKFRADVTKQEFLNCLNTRYGKPVALEVINEPMIPGKNSLDRETMLERIARKKPKQSFQLIRQIGLIHGLLDYGADPGIQAGKLTIAQRFYGTLDKKYLGTIYMARQRPRSKLGEHEIATLDLVNETLTRLGGPEFKPKLSAKDFSPVKKSLTQKSTDNATQIKKNTTQKQSPSSSTQASTTPQTAKKNGVENNTSKLSGCWKKDDGAFVTIGDDGRTFNGLALGSLKQGGSPNSFKIHLPPLVDKIQIRKGSRSYESVGLFNIALQATRIGAGHGIKGRWQRQDGMILEYKSDQSVSASGWNGSWRMIDKNHFEVEWPMIEHITLAKNGNEYSFVNQGFKGTLKRSTGCPPIP